MNFEECVHAIPMVQINKWKIDTWMKQIVQAKENLEERPKQYIMFLPSKHYIVSLKRKNRIPFREEIQKQVLVI